MVGKILQLVPLVVGIIFLALIEILDWVGRMEMIQTKWPKIWKALNNRPARLVLLTACLVFLVKDFRDAAATAPPPIVTLSIPPPVAQSCTGVGEVVAKLALNKLELKKQLMGLSQELSVFVEKQYQAAPRREDYFKSIHLDQQKEPERWKTENDRQQIAWKSAMIRRNQEAFGMYKERFRPSILRGLSAAAAMGLNIRDANTWLHNADNADDCMTAFGQLSGILSLLADKL